MSITLNTYTSGQTLTHTLLNSDNTAITAKFNAGINTSDISANAGITNSQLATDDFEVVLSLALNDVDLNGAHATTYFVVGSLPYDSTGGATGYTVLGIEHLLFLGTGAGITTAIYTLNYGNHTDGWTAIKTGITVGTANGQTRETGFTTDIPLSSTRPKFFVLDATQTGIGYAVGDSWCISIKLKRTYGLRG